MRRLKVGDMTTATRPAGNRVLRRWILVAASLIAIAVFVAAILFAVNWPFTQAAVTKTLQDRFARDVKIRNFRKTYFPPGCVAQGVEFLHRKRKDLPPLITVQTLTIRASYSALLRIHQQVNDVHVYGLHVLIPPKSGERVNKVFPLTNSTSGKNVDIGEISTDNAVLEFMPKEPGQERFVLRIDHLALDHVSESDPVTFHARFKNTEPPGEILSDGQFGPWNDEDPGSTQVSGSYTYQHVKLGVFEGIAGNLSSQGKFAGLLSHIEADGEVDVPDFEVSRSGHPVHLASKFHALIDGTNGDTNLTRVESHFQKTTVITQGDIKGHAGGHGKTARLTFSVDQGRVEDLLWMFSHSSRPAENGNVRIHAKVELPPGPPSFLRRLRLEGDFGIGSGQFTSASVQIPVNRLAESARGEKKDREELDPTVILSNLKGHFAAQGGIASLSNVSFTEPGTLAEIEGTYNLLDTGVKLRGVLHTSGKLADTTAGFKSLVLKALNPLVKKKNITVVPFEINGTSRNPAFSLDLAGKRTLSAKSPPEP
jgi:AsmA-like C-terminal region